MPIYRTENCLVAWREEATFGVAIEPDKRFGLHETVNAPDPEQEWYPFFGVGTDRNRGDMLRGRWNLRGSIPDIKVRDSDALGELLALAFGRFSGGVVSEGISATDGRLKSFTMQIAMRDTDGNYTFIRDYYGGKINRLTLSAAEGEELRVSIDEMIFKDIAHNLVGVTKEGTPALATDPGPGFGGRFIFAGATITVFGTTLCRIRRFSLTIDNQLEPRYYLCKVAGNPEGAMTQVLTDLVEGKRRYQLELEVDVVDPATDLVLFKALMNEGAAGGDRHGTSGPSVGGTIRAQFDLTPGEGSGSLVITAGGVFSETGKPGAVVTSGKINVPGPPTGLFPSSWQVDVDTVSIQIP